MDDVIINETKSTDIQQQYPDTCAIKSQQIILNDFGVPVTEDQCIQHAMEQGWYDGQGTSPEDVGKILVDAGIPCTQRVNGNVYDIAKELADGHKVIVGVDSGELWNNGSLLAQINEWFEDIFNGEMPDHALIVAGIDNSDPNNPMVILTDPGTGESSARYPLEQFMDAWADSQCFMVSTDVATPDSTENFVQNGLTEGHINEVAGVDYNTLVNFQDYSHQIDYTEQGAQLYDMFDKYPTMDNPNFNDALVQYDLPVVDFQHEQPMAFDPGQLNYTTLNIPMNVNPFEFDYNGVGNEDWINADVSQDDAQMQDGSVNTQQQDYIDILQDTMNMAQENAQTCMDDGSYIMATAWDNMANECKEKLSDINGNDDSTSGQD